jgi:hypothetical protein
LDVTGVSEISNSDSSVRPDGDPGDGGVLQADPEPRFRWQLTIKIHNNFTAVNKLVTSAKELLL